jgi:hypothetical protein
MILTVRQEDVGREGASMADLSPVQLTIIAVAVVVIVSLIVFGMRRGLLRRVNFQGLGVSADLEGNQEAKPLKEQTMQTDDFKAKGSWFRIVKGARTSFRRTRFKNSLLEILPDSGTAPAAPAPAPAQAPAPAPIPAVNPTPAAPPLPPPANGPTPIAPAPPAPAGPPGPQPTQDPQ